MTRASYAELSNQDVCREILEKIGDSKSAKVKFKIGGVDIIVKRCLTEQAVQRNSALRRAADVIKADSRFKGQSVEIQWTKERGVTANSIFIFQQNSTDVTGSFDEKFSDMVLPVR